MKKLLNAKTLLFAILILAAFLRIWKIDKVPVSLFGDELDVGYQAYSILKTGKDYSGNRLPLHFQSLAERRTPLYLYSAVPTVAIFGISPLGVRLPAMIFGVLGIYAFYLLVREFLTFQSNIDPSFAEKTALVAGFLLAVSPWHIQYSRAAFEVTELLFFLILGIYLFIRSLNNPKLLWLSAFSLGITPWIYSTAKLFTPMVLIFLVFVWFKDLIKFSKKELIKAVAILLLLGLPMVYTIFSGGGAERFGYISVFTDPTMEGDVGFARLNDAKFEGQSRNLIQKVETRMIHNKYTFWGFRVINNYLSAFSTNFLFIKGDLNLRHSVENVGQLYKVEMIPLVLGLVAFFGFYKNKKIKKLVAFWILAGVIPSAITRDGGNHATRLILILPPMMLLIAYGIVKGFNLFGAKNRKLITYCYILLFLINFVFYEHNYWIHNPWYSERWWHAGFKEMFAAVAQVEGNYDKIIFSNANEPPLIFFLGYYEYPPQEFQKGLQDVYVPGFDTLKHTGKYYFGQVNVEGIYALPKVMDKKTLYVAVEREVGTNLIMEPTRVPAGLKLIKAIAYPSGEPAYYIFAKGD
jgi:4-amino-4-deoxy-L-arabinose transferase-like glycosyltransferase